MDIQLFCHYFITLMTVNDINQLYRFTRNIDVASQITTRNHQFLFVEIYGNIMREGYHWVWYVTLQPEGYISQEVI